MGKSVTLTLREYQCTILASRGLTGSEIADRLGITIWCVKQTLKKARDRTGARNTTHLAVRVAIEAARKDWEATNGRVNQMAVG
jgi:DNA-binding CsgD family transcriptional regulator